MNAITTTGPVGLIPQNMQQAVPLAEMMTKARTLPSHFHGPDKVGDALMVVEQAMRWQMSPFAVAQCTSVISGKLMYEGKIVAAAVQHVGGIEGYFDYQFSGAGESRVIRVTALRRGETQPKEIELALKDARTANKFWTTQPDQQLVYAGTRVWARRWTPGVMLGVYSPEEMEAVAPRDTFTGPTIEAQAEAVTPPEPKKRTTREWLDDLETQLVQMDRDMVDQRIAADDVQMALDKLTNGALDRLNGIVKAALERTAADPADAHYT